MGTPCFVPSEEIARLSKGSFEAQIEQLVGAVSEAKKSLFGESVGDVKILSTFPGRCVVMSDDGRFASVRYESTATGQPKIVGHEKLDVPVVKDAEVGGFLRKEALKAADRFIAGDVKEAVEIAQNVLRLVPQQSSVDENKLVEAIEIELKGARPWQKIYTERLVRIRSMVSDKLGLVENAKLSGKFSKLYDGKMPPEKTNGYRDLVQSDMAYLKDRVTALGDLVEASLESAKPHLASKDLQGEESARTFQAFAEDLLADVRRMQKIVSEGTKLLKIEALGKLYDSIASVLHPREIAGQLVREMSERLCAAGGQ